MRVALPRALTAMATLLAGAAAAQSVAELNFDELISVVFFEDENAYKNPTGFFCRFIALKDKDDFCKVTLSYIEPKLCKVEVTREMRVTWEDGKGREFIKARDIFTLANLNLAKLAEPEIDDAKGTARQSFSEPINVKWHEGYHYSFALGADGKYAACLSKDPQPSIAEEECIRAGQEPYTGTKSLALLFNSANYNRSMAAIRWLQKNYCPVGDPL